MNKISVGIVVKNKPLHFEKTIASVYNFADEIVVFDIGMDTLLKKKLLKKKKVKIIEIKKEISYVEMIREEEKKYLKNLWVLYLDPDEVFPSPALSVIRNRMEIYDCFSFPRKNIIFGKFIKHSRFWPDYQIRLFKKNKVFWPKQLHSQPLIEGKEYIFPAEEKYAIYHYNYENLDHWFEKYLRYAKSEAQFYLNQGKKIDFSDIAKKSLSEFISRYFAFNGYKDGVYGFILAILQMFYYFVVYFYYLEKKNYLEEKTSFFLRIRDYFTQGEREINYWIKKKGLITKNYLTKHWIEKFFEFIKKPFK